MVNLNVFKTLAEVSQSLRVLYDKLVAVVDFSDKCVTLTLVGLLQLAKLPHNIVCVLLQVLENCSLNLGALVDFIHTAFHRFVLVLDLVLENLALGLQVGQLHVDLLKDVKFTICLENGLFQVFDLVICFLRLLDDLVNAVLVRNKAVDDRIDQLLNEITRLRLDIEPKQFETRVLRRESLEIGADKTALLKLFLSTTGLCSFFVSGNLGDATASASAPFAFTAATACLFASDG